MRKYIKLFIAACLYYSGLIQLVRWWTAREEGRLIILNYHRALDDNGNLRSHLLYLRRHYRLLHLEEALEELYRPHSLDQQSSDRRRRTALVLTFDDGYRDNYTHAFRLARELEIPITIFLIPGYMQSGRYLWWMEAERLVRHAQVSEVTLEGCTYHLDQPGVRHALACIIDAHLRYAPSVSEREAFLALAREALAVPASIRVEEDALLFNWQEARIMQASGWVSFGAHTMHHPILAYVKDAAEVQREVSECRSIMERELGHPVLTFAYPVGGPEHIGSHAQRAVHNAGYTWAVTTIPGINTPHTDPHQLRRIESGANRHWLVMAAELAGVWQLFAPLRKHYMFTIAKDDRLAA